MRVNMSTISIILLHFSVNNYFIYIASVSSVFLLGFETVFSPYVFTLFLYPDRSSCYQFLCIVHFDCPSGTL